jgi:hypothetical protein
LSRCPIEAPPNRRRRYHARYEAEDADEQEDRADDGGGELNGRTG